MTLKTIGNEDFYAVVSSVGGTVQEFVYHGENLIYKGRQIGGKSRGGIPICFPFFGKPIACFSSIPQHGWLRNQELSMQGYAEEYGILFVEGNTPTEEFPWQLKYEVTVSIDSEVDALSLKLVTERLKDGVDFGAPINPGFHPYFCADRSNGIATCMARVGSRVLTDFKKESEKIVANTPIIIKSGSRFLKMQLSGDFNPASQLTLWSGSPGEYFCVEPILTQQDVFAKTEGGKFLKEGEKSTIIMQLSVM